MNEQLTHCPVCTAKSLSAFGQAKDYTVSQETFALVQCDACGFVFTNPRPDAESSGPYYQSEEYVSHSNTRKGLIFTLYQWVRSYTLTQKSNFVRKMSPKGRKALDVGCGTGDFLGTLNKQGWEVVGIEPSPDARRQSIDKQGINVLDTPHFYEDSSLKPGSFDLITLWHVLEHVHDLGPYADRLVSLLKPDGILLIAVPNRNALDAKQYGFQWAAWDVPRHLYHFRAQDVKKLFVPRGMEWIKTRVMPFDSFYVSLLSEKYIHGRYRYPAAFIQGLRSLIHAYTHQDTGSSQIYVFRKKD